MINSNNNLIIKKITLRPESQADHGLTNHVAYGTDSNFMMGCAISIASVIQQNLNINFVFHIFTDGLTEDYKDKFACLAQASSQKIVIYILNVQSLDSLPVNKLWSTAIYYRFIIADYFTGITDKVLYLDSDVICKGSLQSLLTKNLSQYLCAAVAERNSEWWLARSQKLQSPKLAEGYFNSGVMLINTQEWAEYAITQRAFEALADPDIVSRLTYYDQDVLNLVCAGRVLFVEPIYNVQYSINYELKSSHKNPIQDSTILVHYIGPTKPWHYWAQYPCGQYFSNAKKSSPWSDKPLMMPTNASQWRYAAKHMIKQKKYLKAIMNYIIYFNVKILGK